ncbi:hypothetical protein USDA257_c04130 [Sinorhizobium fredii USDA 257]|jgi:hypothetical protein|uniref:Uncharacterized protein n=1 Tax=Sinorhizobium fredii (strain USDA 257) TaxID=1185652 RepID=I3WZF4_SINF2|nr:hypothetical protein USDA257_c04130 [Sinorhizobium fredii USDA 257]
MTPDYAWVIKLCFWRSIKPFGRTTPNGWSHPSLLMLTS